MEQSKHETKVLPNLQAKTDPVPEPQRQGPAPQAATVNTPRPAMPKPTDNEKRPNLADYPDSKYPTTTAKIRAMWADGFTKGQISRSGLMTRNGTPIKFQHVRNTLMQAAPAPQAVAPQAQAESTKAA